MTNFFNQQGLAPQVIAFESDDDKDYLLTSAIQGEDGISGEHLSNPEKLADFYERSLRKIHALPTEKCPFQRRMDEMINEAIENAGTVIDADIIPEGTTKAIESLHELKHLAVNDTVIHGDYCLPNIIMDNFQLKEFVDLGSGGVGGRHWDLFWGIWALKNNLNTDK